MTKKDKIFKRDYSNFNEESFFEEVNSVDWQSLFYVSSNVNVFFDTFYSQVVTFFILDDSNTNE